MKLWRFQAAVLVTKTKRTFLLKQAHSRNKDSVQDSRIIYTQNYIHYNKIESLFEDRGWKPQRKTHELLKQS